MPNTDQTKQRSSPPRQDGRQIGQGPLTKAFLISGLLLFVVVLLVYGAGVLIPLAVALLLWFFINALAKGYQRLWSRWLGPLRGLSLVLALLTILAASLLAISVVITNVTAIGASSADFARSLNLLLDKIADFTGMKHEQLLRGLSPLLQH